MRPDLLALTDDDLVALANRGTVKRARQELESLTVTLSEADDGTLTARWSDDMECTLPAGKPLAQAKCTCPAEPPCRHVLRTVMAYTSSLPPRPNNGEPAEPRPNNGEHPLSPIIGGGEARAGGNAAGGNTKGGLFELVRSAKPTARCHSLGTITRFLVPGDPNFSVCDCGQSAPCEHAWMALKAFEQLPEDVLSGLVDTQTEPYTVPTEALDHLEGALHELERVGLAAAPEALWARLQRLETECRKAGLVWPAECLAELVVLKDAYQAQDSRFEAGALALLVGELVLRCAAIRANNGAVPQLFVRGASVDRVLELGSAKLVGLGYGGKVLRSGLQLTAFLQDEDTGQVVAVVGPTAKKTLSKGMTLGAVAAGRVLVRGAKRAPSGLFSFGRAPAALHPQAFAWEKLRAPVLLEGFTEVAAHLALLPPRPLRPRRLAEDFHVVPVTRIAEVGFNTVAQAVIARLEDAQGGSAWLFHPFHHACAAGTEALLAALQAGDTCFVAGAFQQANSGITVQPAALVVEREGTRQLVLPWQEGAAGSKTATLIASVEGKGDFLTGELLQALGELLIGGWEGDGERERRLWRERAQQAEALGFAQLPPLLEALAQEDQAPAALETLLSLATLASES